MNDSQLDQLLKAASLPAPPSQGFQRDVWLRIGMAETAGWKSRTSRALDRVLGFLTLPPIAVTTCAAMAALGAWFGLKAGSPARTGGITYIQSVSPFVQR